MKFSKLKNSSKQEAYNKNTELNDKEITSENIKSVLSDSSDISYQLHYINGRSDLPVTVVFVDGLVNTKMVNDDILKPLTQEKILEKVNDLNGIIDLIEHGTLYHASRKLRTGLEKYLMIF